MSNAIGAFDAKTHLSALLDRVERGEELTITRRGISVARLVPVRVAPQATAIAEAMADLQDLRAGIAARGGAVTWEDLKALRDEGRR